MKTLRDIGEFGLIAKIRNWMVASHPEVVRSIGDDVAVIDIGKKTFLITTDILIEDIHFEPSWIDPYRLGKKSLAINLSDIAAMGAIPKYFLISIGFPKHLSLSFIALFYRGAVATRLLQGAREAYLAGIMDKIYNYEDLLVGS